MAAETDTFRDLLDRWEELHESGQEPDVDELCRKCPQFTARLRDWVRMLKMSDWLNQPAEIAASDTRGGLNELTAADCQPPSILGEYELLEQLGDGGMGQVF